MPGPQDLLTRPGPPDGEAPDDASSGRAPERATVYWIVGALLALGSILLRGSPWRSSEELHTLAEVVATGLALVVGALALVRFYSRKQGTLLFIGTGFLGTAILDGHHALLSSGLLPVPPSSSLADASAWTWTASRLYLSLFLFVSLLAWRRESRLDGGGIREGSVYATAGVLTLVIFAFFSLMPLAGAYHPDFVLGRPAELVPALFFALAFVGYLRKGRWRRDPFEHWLVLSLLMGCLLHALLMSQSRAPYDPWFDVAHAVKVASYLAVLTGLMHSVYFTFRREGEALVQIRGANEALAREVAVRRDAERALQESKERLEHFLDTAHDLIQSTDPEGRILYANRAWRRSLGYGDEDLGDVRLLDVVTPQCRDSVRGAFERVLAGAQAGRIVVEFVARDGRVVVCSGSANALVVDGEAVAIQSIFRDVTEQRRAERELAVSRANLEALVENTGDAIWSVDEDQRLITFNSAFALALEARTGREPFRGATPEELFGAPQAEWYRALYGRALRGERFSELLAEEVDGHLRYVEIYCNPVQDEAGMAGAVMFGKDVTPRKRAEEALVVAKEEAVAANRAKSRFLANMSHELRTPLNSVIGFANILLKNKKGNLDGQQLGFVDRIGSNGRHLLALINEVLDLAKIEAGRMQLELAETDPGELVRDTLRQLEGRVADRDVVLVADVPAGIASFETDPHKLRQVIINLVGNALKFTHEGSVTVRVEAGPDGTTPAAIAVEDTGIGIPPERVEAIFEAFQQADGSTARRYGGTGLGLTISRSICQMLGYEIEVDSEVGRGSTFTVRVAREESDAAVEQPAPGTPRPEPSHRAAGQSPAAREFKVLVVDDDPDSRVLLGHYLEEFGCEVVTAASGEEGLSVARAERPDLVTLDLMMPGMTGWEALRIMKDDPDLRDIPVVVVSIVAGEGARGRLLGAVDLLTKPVEREDLLRVLWRNLVPRRAGRVLVVEDDDDTRTLLSEYLSDAGLEVRTVGDGREALAAVEREAPDAVVLDLVMPVMDGMDFLARLRENPYHMGLPVVVLTGKDLTDRERDVLAEKASSVIVKGAGVEERLREVLGAILPLGGPPGDHAVVEDPSAGADPAAT